MSVPALAYAADAVSVVPRVADAVPVAACAGGAVPVPARVADAVSVAACATDAVAAGGRHLAGVLRFDAVGTAAVAITSRMSRRRTTYPTRQDGSGAAC
ncbi:hypothetical protein [Kribbella swartbergensis]